MGEANVVYDMGYEASFVAVTEDSMPVTPPTAVEFWEAMSLLQSLKCSPGLERFLIKCAAMVPKDFVWGSASLVQQKAILAVMMCWKATIKSNAAVVLTQTGGA